MPRPTTGEPRPPAPPRWQDLQEVAHLGLDDLGEDAVLTGLRVADVFLDGQHSDFAELGELDLLKGSMADSSWYRAQWHDLALHGLDLAALRMEEAGMRRVELAGCRLTGVDWAGCLLDDVLVRDGVADQLNLRMATMSRVRFEDVRLAGVDLGGARASDVVFSGCDLTGAQFSQFRGQRVRLEQCTLDGVQGIESLRGCTIQTADLSTLALQLAGCLGIALD